MCNLKELLEPNKEVLLTGLITNELYAGHFLGHDDALWIYQSKDEDGISAQYIAKEEILKPGKEDNEGYLYIEIIIDENEYNKCIAMLSLGIHIFDYIYQHLTSLDSIEWCKYDWQIRKTYPVLWFTNSFR